MPINYGSEGQAKIKVVGVGGGGGNSVNRMVGANVQGVELIAINTDKKALDQSNADKIIHIGVGGEGEFGAGGDPAIGAQAAEEGKDKIREALAGADMVFVTAGEGGGTGTGASPVVAEIARDEIGALTVGIVTKPWDFEGRQCATRAEEGINLLSQKVDALIVIPNDRLTELSDKKTTLGEAYFKADEPLHKGVQGITELINVAGLVNVDFADVRTTMKDSGTAIMGIGIASGENRAVEAAQMAINSSLYEAPIMDATRLLWTVTSGPDFTMQELVTVGRTIQACTSEDAHITWGQSFDESMTEGDIRVTVIATGFKPAEGKSNANDPLSAMFSGAAQNGVASQPAAVPTTVQQPVPPRTTVSANDSVVDAGYIPDFLNRR